MNMQYWQGVFLITLGIVIIALFSFVTLILPALSLIGGMFLINLGRRLQGKSSLWFFLQRKFFSVF